MGRAKKKTGATRDINQTINALGLDPDLDPEVAAQMAAEDVANSGESEEEVASTVVVDNVPSDDVAAAAAEDEEGDDEGVDDAKIDVPLPPPPPEEPERAIVPPTSSKTRSPKAKTRERSTPAGKLGKSIAEKVPGAEKIKVYKREKGQRWFVNDYTKNDLSTFPDFESFLVRYVKDDHGPGEYDLVGVDAANREIELGQVRLKAMPQQTMESGTIGLLQQMMVRQEEQAKDHVARMEKAMMQQPQQTDPLQLLAGVLQMSDQLREKAMGNQGDNGMSAMLEMMSQSSDKSMQMMMMMMMQQQQAAQAAAQQQQQMMMQLMQPRPDPFMDFLKAKMAEEGSLGGGNAAPPPPPPPAPKESTAELITALAGFMAAMGGGGGGEPAPDDFKEFAKALLMKQQSEGLGVKDVLNLVLAEKNKPGTDDFRSAVDNMAAIMNIANNMNRQQEGGPAAGFFDAVAALFGNRDFAGSMANAIRAKTGGGAQGGGGAPPTVVQQLAAQNQALRRQLAMAQGGMTPQQGGVPVHPQPRPVQTVVTPAQQQAAQQPRQSQSTPQTPPQQVAPAPTPEEIGLPDFPANTPDHLNNIILATDEAGLVEAVINMFLYYAEFEQWQVFSENFFDHVRRGNEREALRYLGALFGGLAQQNIIEREMAMKILGAFKNNFAEIQANLDDIILRKDETITGDDLLAVDDEEEGDDESDDEGEEDESTE